MNHIKLLLALGTPAEPVVLHFAVVENCTYRSIFTTFVNQHEVHVKGRFVLTKQFSVFFIKGVEWLIRKDNLFTVQRNLLESCTTQHSIRELSNLPSFAAKSGITT